MQYATSTLLRRNTKANKADMATALHTLGYLLQNSRYGLILGKDPDGHLYGYVDSSHADQEGAKSTESFIFFYKGSPISWRSKAQSIVAPRSSLAEFIAWASAVKEALFLKRLIEPVDGCITEPILIYTNSANALSLLNKPSYSPTLKGIGIRFFFVKDAVADDLVRFEYVASEENVADTKPLPGPKFDRFYAKLN
ncbi:Ty1/Copia family ribonuclease HI [Aspergillus affinis]|uniref:Ty1/Copia family ribonuclease HI n=1 Tax=Aspergillus affinis TaxID=1070780 RepID=UPI0022FE4E3F|nr:uncharacterized protein KD926_006817 [Aspergillus affinis]KAI9041421.1 hypothetical protein KD926_006817 [Aspergillus affinis]